MFFRWGSIGKRELCIKIPPHRLTGTISGEYNVGSMGGGNQLVNNSYVRPRGEIHQFSTKKRFSYTQKLNKIATLFCGSATRMLLKSAYKNLHPMTSNHLGSVD